MEAGQDIPSVLSLSLAVVGKQDPRVGPLEELGGFVSPAEAQIQW